MALDNAPPWRDAIRPRVGALALPVLGSYQAVLATPFLGRRFLTTSGHFVRAMIRGASGPRKRWSDRELDAYSEVLKQSSRARASTSCYQTFLTRELAEAALAATGPATCEYQHYSRWDRRAPCGGLCAPPAPRAARGDDPVRSSLPARGGPGEVFKLAKGWLEESSGSDRRRRSRVARTTTPTRR